MKKGVLLLLLLLFAINSASSQTQTLGGIDGFPPGKDINLIQTCTNCTFVNLTFIVLGSGQLENISRAMTKEDTFYNFNLTANLTTSLGEYTINWVADPDGIKTSGNYNLFVRNNGVLLTTAESVLYIFVALLNLIAVVFFLFQGITLPYTSERTKDGTLTRLIPSKYLKLLSILIGYGALIWLSSIMTSIINNFISLESVLTLMTNLHLFMYVLAYPLTVLILAIIMIETWIDIFVPLFQKIFMGITKKRSTM